MLNEWGVVEVIVVLIGLFATVGKPLLNNTKVMAELNCSIKQLSSDQKSTYEELLKLKEKNTESHRRIWLHNDKQDEEIQKHDTRILMLEKSKEDR